MHEEDIDDEEKCRNDDDTLFNLWCLHYIKISSIIVYLLVHLLGCNILSIIFQSQVPGDIWIIVLMHLLFLIYERGKFVCFLQRKNKDVGMTKLLYFQFLPSVVIIFGILAIKFRWHFELSMSFCLYFSIYFSATLIERKMLKNSIKFTTREKFKNSLSEMLRVQL